MSNTRAIKDFRCDTINVEDSVTATSITASGAVSAGSLSSDTFTAPLLTLGSTTFTTAAAGTEAIPATHDVVFIDTTAGASALSLAVGAAGAIKILMLTVDGGDATLTKANGNLGATVATSIVFADAGDTVHLISTGAAWEVVSNSGATIS